MLTRDELAKELGLPSGSTINKWERGINPIPDWVAEKMYRTLPIEFTIDELAELYDICRELQIGMHQLIADALRPMLQDRIRHRELKAQPQPKFTTRTILRHRICEALMALVTFSMRLGITTAQ